MATGTDSVEMFLRLSEVLTGYERIVLLGTGMVEAYYDELIGIIGAREVGALLAAGDRAVGGDKTHEQADAAFRRAIWNSDRFGPVARNITAMWYLGTWQQLPREWRDQFGAMALDYDRVVSAKAYREGLAWRAAQTHPMGAKQPGFGSWSTPPDGD